MDLSYLAGFFDGEGSISISRIKGKLGRNDIFVVLISISNTNPEILSYICKEFGGNFHQTKHQIKDGYKRKNIYKWSASSKIAENFLSKILPYLILKKEQANMALEFQKTLKRKGNQRLSVDELDYRKMVKLKIMELNQKEYYINKLGGRYRY